MNRRRMQSNHWMIRFLLLPFILPLLTSPALPQSPTEYQVKAAFLYYFAKFIEWPHGIFPAESTPIFIGILGEDPFELELDETIRGKTANGRELFVKRSEELSELKNCHILFISSAEKERIPYILDSLRGLSILTVSETDNFIEEGGIVNFVIIQNRVQFEINLQAATGAKLKISSKLLNVARTIRSNAG
ncbi:YfiR family protein [bacterium]|nr:YfiR family protein [bacterium]MCI0603058.1 YfiR family protein [bacterium]